ncbi:hypothetical protein NQ315_008796, partial [Exocentrus adspersus]
DSDETANAICNNLKEKLQDAGLNLLKMSSYSADNASVNFGKHHSVYRLLKNENEHLVPVGCPAHMLHNASKNALDKCNFDVETLVLKVYCHFSSHAKRVRELKDFFNFVDVEYRTVIRHVTTRAVVVSCPIRSYFASLGSNCPVPLQKYFPEETEGESASGKERTLTECYLAFFDNILKLLYDTVLALEKNNLMCCEVYFVLQTLRNKLNQRVTDKFVGFLCSNILCNFTLIYYNTLKQNLIFLIAFSALTDVVESTGLKNNVNMDELYEEFCQIREALELAVGQKKEKTVIEKWCEIFKANPTLKNMLSIFQYVTSIPTSNAAAERVFSLCTNTWSENRNRLLVEHVKAELQIKVNYTQNCREFYNLVLSNKKLLQAVKSQNKYSFKNKNQ